MRQNGTRRKRAISYVRQSTEREESISLESQDEINRRYAQHKGYEVIATYTDPGISAFNTAKRDGLRQAIEAIKTNQAEVIVVWRWSRLSRSTPDHYRLDGELQEAGGQVESSTEDNSFLGKGLGTLLSDHEARQISGTWKEAHRRRVHRGLPSSGHARFGYKRQLDSNDKQVRDAELLPDEDTPVGGTSNAEAVREMFRLYLAGHSTTYIAKWLNDRGVKLLKRKPRGIEGAAPAQAKFSVSSVRKILDNVDFYAGYIDEHSPDCPVKHRPKEKRVRCPYRQIEKGKHEALISEDTRQRYKELRDPQQKVYPKQPKVEFWLTGLIQCGLCGGLMHPDSMTADKPRLRCYNAVQYGSCPGTRILASRIKNVVGPWVLTRAQELAELELATLDVDEKRAQLIKELEAEKERAEGIKRAKTRARTRYASDPDWTDQEFEEAIAQADKKLKPIQEHILTLQAELDQVNPETDVWSQIINARGMTVSIPAWVTTGYEEPPEEFWELEPEYGGDNPISTEEYNLLLRKVIRRVVVNKEAVAVVPFVGDPYRVSRNTMRAQRSAGRKPEPDQQVPTARIQERDAKGKFIKAG